MANLRIVIACVSVLGLALFLAAQSGERKSGSAPLKPEEIISSGRVDPIEEPPPTPVFDWNQSTEKIATVHETLGLPHFSEEESLKAQTIIAHELLGRLEMLSQSSPQKRRGVDSRLSDISDALTLLERRKRLGNLDSGSAKVLTESMRPRLLALQKVWRENPVLAKKVDDLFSRTGHLTCEHVPQLLLEWTAS